MYTKAAVLVGSSVLAIATLSSAVQAQTRWPVTGNYYYRPVAARPEPERPKAETPRPSRASEIVYLNVEGGYQSLSISTLTARDLTPSSVGTSGNGAFYGVGAGFRFAFLTLGGRVRGANLNVGSLSTIDGELGAHIALDRFEPYFTFAAGYAKLAALGGEVAGIPDLDIHGWNARAGVGFDYYADKNFSVGLNLTGEVLAMARPGIDLSTSPEAQARARVKTCESLTNPTDQQQCASNTVHDAEGASAGFAGTASVVMGLHF
jgi:hypothetical protein